MALLLLPLATAARGQDAEPPVTLPGTSELTGDCAEGVRLFRAQRAADAERLLVSCVEETGDRLEPLVYLNVIAVMNQRPQDGLRWGERAVRIGPGSADAHYWYGRALLQSGATERAKEEWEAGLACDTEHRGLLEALARLAMDHKEDAEAYGLLTQLQRVGVDEGWVHRLMATLARRKGLWGEAARHWRDAMARDGEDAASLLAAAELSLLAGEPDASITDCRRALELEPTAEAWGVLGESLYAVERYEEALDALRRAVEMAPGEARYRFNLAGVLDNLDRSDEAEQHFRAFVEMAPDDPIGRLNYGIHLEKRGRTGAALAEVTRAVSLDPDLLAARVVQAQMLEKLGRYDEAIAVVDTLAARDHENMVQLAAWRERLRTQRGDQMLAIQEGKVHLQHIILQDEEVLGIFQAELEKGIDFSVLATRFSLGPSAAQGGDIGWIAPSDMIQPLRGAIEDLEVGEISPPMTSGGLYHVFKRLN